MAIVKFGTTITGARGTIASATFSQNQSGTYLKSWARPSRGHADLQVDVRRSFSVIAQLWSTLSQGDRDDWNTFASEVAQEQTNALTNTFYLTGFQWFVKSNQRIDTDFRAYRLTFPASAYPTLPTLTSLVATSDPGEAVLTFPDSEFGPTYDCAIFGAVSNSSAALVAPTNYKLVDILYLPAGDHIHITDPLGYHPVGTKLFLQVFRQTSDGMRSAEALIDCILT